MSAGIPNSFKIDFSQYDRDLSWQAIGRFLEQFKNSPVLADFVRSLIKNGPQWTYDEIIKQQEANTIFSAEGFNLEAIGRIVGQPRIPYQYDDSQWLFSDRQGQGVDQAPAWVTGAPLTGNMPANDSQYRQMILARIASNFNRFSSLPEMAYLAKFTTGETVSWRTVGPMEGELIVRPGISRSNLDILTRKTTTTEDDDIFALPYPATYNLTYISFVPEMSFIADRGNGHQADAGLVSLTRSF